MSCGGIRVAIIEQLTISYFLCPKCQDWRTVEAKGVVIAGPVCKACHTAMRRVELQQLDLGLFADPEKKKPSRRAGH